MFTKSGFLKLFFLSIFCTIYAYTFSFHILFPIMLVLLFLYLWLLFIFPEIALCISFFVIFNGFGFLHEDLFRLPYIFRIRDIFFISLFFPVLKGVLRRDGRISHVFKNPLAGAVFFLIWITVFQILITKYRYPTETLSSIFRIARQYLYYAVFFPALYILSDREKLMRFLKVFMGMVLLFCVLFIIQVIIGSRYKIFPFGRVEYQNLQGFRVVRMYLGGITVPALLFQISLMLLLFSGSVKNKVWTWVIFVLTGLQTVLTFYRAHIFGVVAGSFFGVLFAKGQPRFRRLLKIILIVIIVLMLAEFGFKIFAPNKEDVFDAITARMTSIYSAVLNQNDTIGYRLMVGQGEINIISRNPLLGGGFVHDESNLFASERIGGRIGFIRAGESGLLTLVFDLGVFGLIWLIYLSVAFLRHSWEVYSISKDEVVKSITLGLVSFYIGRLVSFIVEPAFVDYSSLLLVVIAMVFVGLLPVNMSKEFHDK